MKNNESFPIAPLIRTGDASRSFLKKNFTKNFLTIYGILPVQ
ncbi:hypothetical protein SXCC_02445 [Gluconacetobacter sp. SXCC-1]|nr:hypothetical protein SXCC_02445 [Gluconacetobacter sp. SXCC-1]